LLVVDLDTYVHLLAACGYPDEERHLGRLIQVDLADLIDLVVLRGALGTAQAHGKDVQGKKLDEEEVKTRFLESGFRTPQNTELHSCDCVSIDRG
jgi:hypothetical protein